MTKEMKMKEMMMMVKIANCRQAALPLVKNKEFGDFVIKYKCLLE